ncbi:sensor histidine kinase [Occultella gossypii]|uniref:histidine kinase n=1 Tax=Occultella gossypii TaxID=2800820 RepID=A0ABS7SCA3_9MICO|nr:HAMP domain-containing sensor histidine kinase [Occultella gossypii]MBZ2197989.1 HAMP domain-containing histidine kinase [Occultella gossypii]MBZ2199631.1 HAMP domain-containing histidine kinase [Occultella gossypii]
MATRRFRLRASVRTRVLVALVLLTTVTVALAGTTAYILESQRIDDRIEAVLRDSVAEFTKLAQQGIDPATGAAFASADALLRTALSRMVVQPNEAMFGMLGTEVALEAGAGPTQQWLDEDPELVAAVASSASLERSRFWQVTTDARNYYVAAVPVTPEPGGVPGALVLAWNLDAEHAELGTTFRTYALVALGAIVWMAIIGWFVVGSLLEPIKLLRTTAGEISSSSDLSRRIAVVGNDDLAVLTETVNGMLARLEDAFGSQRQLLDDVGHELRTPLTIVRGHLELMDPADPTDAASTKELVLDELDRMNGLVEDLVTLAKASRPDFVIAEPTDIALLTDEVLTKARPLGDRRWVLDGLADVTADVDPRRITQALLQLVQNAVKFSEPGSTIALGSSATSTEVRLWVRDEGAGIAEQHLDKIFDRFERAGSPAEGSGLGLTIVRSIAVAHGGRATVESRLGNGTTVSIYLPLMAESEKADSEPTDSEAADDPTETTSPAGDAPSTTALERR